MQKTPHRPFLFITLFFILGILCQGFFSLHPFFWFGASFIVSILAFFQYKRSSILDASLILLFFLFLGGSYTVCYKTLPNDHITFIRRFYYDKDIIVDGCIVSEIRKGRLFKTPKQTFTLKVDRIKTEFGWQKKSGNILVNVFGDRSIHYGDVVEIEGKLHRPFNFSKSENFSYADYLKQRGIYDVFMVKKKGRLVVLNSHRGNVIVMRLLQLRDRLETILARNFTANETAVIQAILLGDRSFIPKHFQDIFVHTGTVHILAISGMNVSLVAGCVMILLKMIPLPRKAQLILTSFFVIGYCILTGASPSVVRATIMIIIFLMSFILEREPESLNTLSISAFAILLCDPLFIYDIGFQLSFICVLSLIILTPRTNQLFLKVLPIENFNLARSLLLSLSSSIAVLIGVGGFIVYYFQLVTPVTIFANLIVIPLASLIVFLGFGLLLTASFSSVCETAFCMCLKVVFNLMIASIYWFNKIPGAYFKVAHFNKWSLLCYYLVLLAILSLKMAGAFKVIGNIQFFRQKKGRIRPESIDKDRRL